MSGILLQTIVEKLEGLEIALLKHGNADKFEETPGESITAVKAVQSELIKLSSDFNTNNEKLNSLSEEICALRLNLVKPAQNQVSIYTISISSYGSPLVCL